MSAWDVELNNFITCSANGNFFVQTNKEFTKFAVFEKQENDDLIVQFDLKLKDQINIEDLKLDLQNFIDPLQSLSVTDKGELIIFKNCLLKFHHRDPIQIGSDFDGNSSSVSGSYLFQLSPNGTNIGSLYDDDGEAVKEPEMKEFRQQRIVDVGRFYSFHIMEDCYAIFV